jgi:hypothetical protein
LKGERDEKNKEIQEREKRIKETKGKKMKIGEGLESANHNLKSKWVMMWLNRRSSLV